MPGSSEIPRSVSEPMTLFPTGLFKNTFNLFRKELYVAMLVTNCGRLYQIKHPGSPSIMQHESCVSSVQKIRSYIVTLMRWYRKQLLPTLPLYVCVLDQEILKLGSVSANALVLWIAFLPGALYFALLFTYIFSLVYTFLVISYLNLFKNRMIWTISVSFYIPLNS